jgi:hypothetical protein
MEERVKTSFIPKASLKVEHAEVKHRGPVSLVNLVAGLILLIVILAAAGVFLYEKFSEQNIISKQASLERYRAAFEPDTIRELARLDTRIASGRLLLRNHVAVSKLFDELEKLVLASVRFNDFSYKYSDATHVILTASGEAGSFNAVALQSDAFSKSPIITEPIFSNVNISKTGTILFNFTAVVDTSRIGYTALAGAGGQGAPASTSSNAPAQSNVPPQSFAATSTKP